MSDHKHTPGPWQFHFNRNFDNHPRVMAGKDCVASTIGTKTTRDNLTTAQKEANARLIAAAPELLDAAEFALDVLIGCCVPAGGCDDRSAIIQTQKILREAIAKAKGDQP